MNLFYMVKEKNFFMKLISWFVKEQKRDYDWEEDEEEFNKFLERTRRRMEKISEAQRATSHEARAQVALMFEEAYTQKKMVEANRSLKFATWVLAVATIAFTVGTVYGASELNKTIQIALQILVGFLAIGLAWGILKAIWKFVRFISRSTKTNSDDKK